ncbi:hypothetical protein U27_01935 [Candidatus Vecturithrix granuli]|uniref:Uncharacterized protein n=1 Tax=Vecturithrix granuli TaxID=1499967 RepID=A0A0S6W643_VECG1|nr:hypothetical protein U27_01935 [Candidatus Vecturithrix granuli]
MVREIPSFWEFNIVELLIAVLKNCKCVAIALCGNCSPLILTIAIIEMILLDKN